MPKHKDTKEGYVTDRVGRPVIVGDTIVFVSHMANRVNLKVGVVTGFRHMIEPFKEYKVEHDASPEAPKVKMFIQFEDEAKPNMVPTWQKRFVRV